MIDSRDIQPSLALFVVFGLCAVSGCGSEVRYQPNHIYLAKQQDTAHIELAEEQRQDIADLLELFFGTSDDPALSRIEALEIEGAEEVLDPSLLKMASGPVHSNQQGQSFGLYRKHCAHCHGIAGDGAGPTASFLVPYPRDFRRGIFKYKSTSGSVTPPTHDDLVRILRDGNPGTAMPSFELLSDRELQALAHYVKVLAMRGEVERALIFESIDVLEDEYDRLVDLSLQEEAPRRFNDQMRYIDRIVTDVVRRWAEAPREVTPVPPKPAAWELQASIMRGRELYLSEVANCVKCHGEQGRGDGLNDDYDDWTREIVDPLDPSSADRYIAIGALPPRKVQPRDLRRGIYRGGGRPEDLYRRIHNGIAGTPMPAAPIRPADAPEDDQRLDTNDIWHLVDYVRALAEG